MPMKLLFRAALPILLLLAVVACPGKGDNAHDGTTPVDSQLPPLELRDDTKDLLLTWVDKNGDFKVTQSIQAVPEHAREKVRVVIVSRREGQKDPLYVADLRNKGANGSYPVRTMSRAEWDEVGAARRKARLEQLAPGVASARAAAQASASSSAAPDAGAPGQITVIIYGAEWCKPCHDVARHLRRRGVKFIEKDIDESAVARREMEQKLQQSGLASRGSIPIIDVGGRLLIGFNPSALDRALDDARAGKAL